MLACFQDQPCEKNSSCLDSGVWNLERNIYNCTLVQNEAWIYWFVCVHRFFSVKSEKDVFDKNKEFYPAFSHQFFGDKWVGCRRFLLLTWSSFVVEKSPSIANGLNPGVSVVCIVWSSGWRQFWKDDCCWTKTFILKSPTTVLFRTTLTWAITQCKLPSIKTKCVRD